MSRLTALTKAAVDLRSMTDKGILVPLMNDWPPQTRGLISMRSLNLKSITAPDEKRKPQPGFRGQQKTGITAKDMVKKEDQ